MGKQIKAVDTYIAKAQPFAQPILEYLREIVHSVHPEINEVIKWGFPNFDYKGPVCSMASFKAHCAFSFWKGAIMKDEDSILQITEKDAMGSLGKITSIKDLPPKKVIVKYIKQAIKLNEEGIKVPKKTSSKTEITIPEDLANALAKNKKAQKHFQGFSPSHRKEYIMWIEEAKREETRKKRIESTVEWVSEGKGRNWKYEK